MNAIIKSATILDKQSDFNTVQDILVENGFIKKLNLQLIILKIFP